jgi:hypothetical protein
LVRMRSASLPAFGQPRETKPTVGTLIVKILHLWHG